MTCPCGYIQRRCRIAFTLKHCHRPKANAERNVKAVDALDPRCGVDIAPFARLGIMSPDFRPQIVLPIRLWNTDRPRPLESFGSELRDLKCSIGKISASRPHIDMVLEPAHRMRISVCRVR